MTNKQQQHRERTSLVATINDSRESLRDLMAETTNGLAKQDWEAAHVSAQRLSSLLLLVRDTSRKIQRIDEECC